MIHFHLPEHPRISVRLILMLIGIVGLATASYLITGSIYPRENELANIFQSGLLLVVLGSLLLEDKFTKPADAVINALTALISLITVLVDKPGLMWILIASYCLFVFVSGVVCILMSGSREVLKVKNTINYILYTLSTTLGKASVIFSVVFLFSVIIYYGVQSSTTVTLVIFWGAYIALWPFKIPHIIEALLLAPKHETSFCGKILRLNDPNLIKIKLEKDFSWETRIVIACLGDGSHRVVLPLFRQIQDEGVIGTGLLLDEYRVEHEQLKRGSAYLFDGDIKKLETASPLVACTIVEDLAPIGLLCEGSTISKVKFETWCPDKCHEGLLVYCDVHGQKIYYQVLDASTREEDFYHHRYGFQVVEAIQLGILDNKFGFKKYDWLPEMNTPVFCARGEKHTEMQLQSNEFAIGKIPGSCIEVVCDIRKMISHHTAILGTTGSGKTELAYDIIRRAIKDGVKVFCVDITADYGDRLEDLSPKPLSISDELSENLGEALFGVETGTFGAPNEKKVLKEYTDKLISEIDSRVAKFLESKDQLGIFSLPSISNTKTTILITELYLSSIFRYAKENRNKNRILVVLEEAHTVIPESKTMGVAGNDAQGMIARIAQIALQGRKYNVGLLVIAQRTATVSKTVLTQCNTIISFSCFDQTGVEFLSNFYGAEYASKLSNLKWLQALIFGKGVKSERPVVIEVPYIKEKDVENQIEAK